MTDENDFRSELRRVHERIDMLSRTIGELSIRIEAFISRTDAIGTPGKADVCLLHRSEIQQLRENFSSNEEKINQLDDARIRRSGFNAGVATVCGIIGGILGSVIALVATLLAKKAF